MEKLFCEEPLSSLLEELKEEIEFGINMKDGRDFLELNAMDIVETETLEKIGIDLENQKINIRELKIPIKGSCRFFACKPSAWYSTFPAGNVDEDSLFIPFDRHNPTDNISKKLQENVDLIKLYIEAANRDIEKYNAELPTLVKRLLKDKETDISKNRKILSEIVLPA